MQWAPPGSLERCPQPSPGRLRLQDTFRSRAMVGAGGAARPGPGPLPWGVAGGATGQRASGHEPACRPSAAGADRRPGSPVPPYPPARPGGVGPGPRQPVPDPRSGKRKTVVSLDPHEDPPSPFLQAAHLDLAEGHEESEGLVEVGGSRALPGRRLSPLPFPLIQHELDLHVGLWASNRGWRVMLI